MPDIRITEDIRGQAVPSGVPRQDSALDIGRRQREPRLAHLRFRAGVDLHGPVTPCPRSAGCRSWTRSCYALDPTTRQPHATITEREVELLRWMDGQRTVAEISWQMKRSGKDAEVQQVIRLLGNAVSSTCLQRQSQWVRYPVELSRRRSSLVQFSSSH